MTRSRIETVPGKCRVLRSDLLMRFAPWFAAGHTAIAAGQRPIAVVLAALAAFAVLLCGFAMPVVRLLDVISPNNTFESSLPGPARNAMETSSQALGTHMGWWRVGSLSVVAA